MRKLFTRVTFLWLSFFIALGVVVYFANFRFNLYGDHLYPSEQTLEVARKAETLKFWENLYRWDAGWYAHILEHGYNEENIAFFPLYPLLLSALLLLLPEVGNAFDYAAFLIALVSVWYSVYAIIQLARKETGRELELFPALLLLFFPTSFFLGAPYTEGLFIALMLGAVLMMKERRFVWAGVFTFLLSLTRVVGIAFALFPIYLYFFSSSSEKKNIRTLIPAVASGLGLVSFLLYQKITFGTFFAFLHAQKNWGRNTSLEIGNIIERYRYEWSSIADVSIYHPEFIVFATNLTFACFGLAAVVFLIWRKKYEYALVSAAFLCIPLLSGTFYSMPRLVLPIVPLFAIFFAEYVRSDYVRHMVLIACALLWAIFLVAFSRLYWVA